MAILPNWYNCDVKDHGCLELCTTKRLPLTAFIKYKVYLGFLENRYVLTPFVLLQVGKSCCHKTTRRERQCELFVKATHFRKNYIQIISLFGLIVVFILSRSSMDDLAYLDSLSLYRQQQILSLFLLNRAHKDYHIGSCGFRQTTQ